MEEAGRGEAGDALAVLEAEVGETKKDLEIAVLRQQLDAMAETEARVAEATREASANWERAVEERDRRLGEMDELAAFYENLLQDLMGSSERSVHLS